MHIINRNSSWDWVENIVDKGENADYQHFLLYPQCFHKASFSVNSLPDSKFSDFTKVNAFADEKKKYS